jgi:zinc protease
MNRAIRLPATMFALILLGLLQSSGTVRAQSKDAPYEKGITIEGITEYRLKNGCKFLLFPDPASSTVTVNMTVLVGSRHEGFGESGMAHLLEHMLFKGCAKFPQVNDIDKALLAHGASEANATTSLDRTNYYEVMPATWENLKFGIELEADRLIHSFIRREDLQNEMKVVRNEFEIGENRPDYILSQRMIAAAFEWHNYGKNTIGNRSDIERVPIENLHAFYRKYYQPDNIVVIVAGKFDEAKAANLIAEKFGAIPVPRRKLDNTYTEEPPQDGEHSVVLRRIGKGAMAGAVYHIPAAAHEDHPAVELLSTILGDAPSGRLYKRLVEKKLATKVTAGAYALHDPGMLEAAAVVADNVEPKDLCDQMIAIIEGISTEPATKEEVERARTRYLAERKRAMAKSKDIALELSDWVSSGDWRLLFIHRDRVEKVTPDDVTRVARLYLKQTNRTTGLFLPSKELARTTVPPRPDVATLVKDYKGGKGIALGEQFDPTPENLERRIQRFTLPNGMKVALLPKKTRGEAVVGEIVLRFGTEASLKEFKDVSAYLGPMLSRGTKHHSREQLKDALDKLDSAASVSSGVGAVSFDFETKRGQLAQVLDLVREMMREPTFPQPEFDIIKRSHKQSLEKQMVDPQSLASLALRRKLRPLAKDDIRYIPTHAEALEHLEKIARDDVVRLYEQRVGGGTGEIVLLGDFDTEAVTKQLSELFAGWKKGAPYERIADKIVPGVKGGRETIDTPEKENAVYIAGVMFEMRDSDPDYPALAIGEYILGSSGFTARLTDRLRQKEGWSYSAGSRLSVGDQDKVGSLLIYATYKPEFAERLDAAAIEELRKLLKEGVTADELAAARTGYLESMKAERGDDGTVAGMVRRGLYLGRTFAHYADLEKKIAALTVKDVNQALAKHLDAGRLVIVRAGDFSKKNGHTPK